MDTRWPREKSHLEKTFRKREREEGTRMMTVANSDGGVILKSKRRVSPCRCHELSLQRIELAIASVSSPLANQLVASESQSAHDHGQSAVVTLQVNLTFSFLSRFSIISFPQIASSPDSCLRHIIAVFRLVDNVLSSSLQIVHLPKYKRNRRCGRVVSA